MAGKPKNLSLVPPGDPEEWPAFAALDAPRDSRSAQRLQLAKLVAIRRRIAKDKAAREVFKAKVEMERQERRLRGKGVARGIVHLYAPELSGAAKTRAKKLVRIAHKNGDTAKETLDKLQEHGLDKFIRQGSASRRKRRTSSSAVGPGLE